MSDTSKLSTCQIVCWGLSGLAGLIVLWSAAGAVGFLAALLLAIAFAALLGLVSTRLVCTGYGPEDRGIEARDVENTLRQATGVTGYKAPDPDEDDSPAPAPPTASADEVAPAPSAAEPTATAATAETSAAVRTGTTLAGEEELAARKGAWRYGDEDDAKAAPDDAGTRPAALDAPREGKADDLKKIKGVGPKLEKLINEMGFYHFDQIAGWTEAEIAWVDDNLKGFKGRVSRDNWVAQAKILAEGGETEFSHRVDEGDVY
ncbi:NADH:ubiquinone oxidoreductase [Roseovarius ramblicola]|uniref:NADH:ubiquinone oxidoreductase n=1 Tax=Roseovarius ramblicola TaxID=2022336 RepID=A0ABV5I268_9RHOB